MTLDSGILQVYDTQNTAEAGAMPVLQLVTPYPDNEYDFGYLNVSNQRYYAAAGADRQIDDLVRVWQDRRILPGFYCVIEDDQYRIDRVQHHNDEDGLPVSDLTLIKREDYYDADEET